MNKKNTEQTHPSATSPHRYQQQIEFWTRDEFGLLKDVEYLFKTDEPNRVDWFKMLPKKYLVPNRDKFPEGTDFKSLNIEDLEDNQVLITLAGMRYLCSLRGYTKVEQKIVTADENYVATECHINFIPNFECGMKEMVFVGEGEAHLNNTKSFAKNFLVPISCNRSFVRCVRNFLEIPVLSSEELGDSKNCAPEQFDSTSISGGISPKSALVSTMARAGISFETIKKRYIQEGSQPDSTPDQIKWKEKAEKWVDESSPEPMDIFVIIKRLNDRIKAKEQKNPMPE